MSASVKITNTPTRSQGGRLGDARRRFRRHRQLYLVVVVPMAFVFIFRYLPLYGLQIAFKDYFVLRGIWGSPWVGLRHFRLFFSSYLFGRLITNTIVLSVYNIVAGVLPPIVLAIALNEARSVFLKKTVQLAVYAPYFLSTVIVTSILMQILSSRGFVNQFLGLLDIGPVQFLGEPRLFKSVYVWSGVWQMTGYNAVIYIAALAGINPELYEAARVDGTNKWQQVRHIDIPGILPTAIILLILSTSRVLNVGFEKVLLLQNPMNLRTSDVLDTFIYRMGLINFEYSYSTAIGLFKSVVNLLLLTVVNAIARRASETSLW